MQEDFHYYATYSAAYLAGYTHEESLEIAYSCQMVDLCSVTMLSKIGAPINAATTQLSLELMDANTDLLGLQNITRIWASFHFLPYDLHATIDRKVSSKFLKRYRLICKPNGKLLETTVNMALYESLQHLGLTMHILADTWAHQYFVGTPSLAMNNTNYHFYEILENNQRPVNFKHNPKGEDDLEKGVYTNSIYQMEESSIMNLGHGRAGHLPDYSFIRYRYLPAWANYEEIVKDNPSDYMHAYAQMVYAMKQIRQRKPYENNHYAWDEIEPYKEEIQSIIEKRQLSASVDWKDFGERLSGETIEDFDVEKYQEQYLVAQEKNNTFIGKFILAALAQKSMVTNAIYTSGNNLAGISIDYNQKGFKGIKDFRSLLVYKKGDKHD